MNKTKKRAAKRSNAKPTVTKFKWPYPLRSEFKIKNLKAYRDYHHSSLGDAKTAVETAMMSHLFP